MSKVECLPLPCRHPPGYTGRVGRLETVLTLPFKNNIVLVMGSDWNIPWAYFNTNNITRQTDLGSDISHHYGYTYRDSGYPKSMNHTIQGSLHGLTIRAES